MDSIHQDLKPQFFTSEKTLSKKNYCLCLQHWIHDGENWQQMQLVTMFSNFQTHFSPHLKSWFLQSKHKMRQLYMLDIIPEKHHGFHSLRMFPARLKTPITAIGNYFPRLPDSFSSKTTRLIFHIKISINLSLLKETYSWTKHKNFSLHRLPVTAKMPKKGSTLDNSLYSKSNPQNYRLDFFDNSLNRQPSTLEGCSTGIQLFLSQAPDFCWAKNAGKFN